MSLSTKSCQETDAGASESASICLIGGPYVLQSGMRSPVPEGSKKLLAFVALHGGRADRRQTAGTLWPGGSDVRAAGNLRSSLWRLREAGIQVIEADKSCVGMRRGAITDIQALDGWANRIIHGNPNDSDLHIPQLISQAVNLLPGWYDDWVVSEREFLRQRLLHALESLCQYLASSRHFAEGVEAAMSAIRIEPLRESATRALVSVHLSEGNAVEALRSYEAYKRLVHRELGVLPSPDFTRIIDQHVPGRSRLHS
jgi:DNA-binding SARP family transcriptional activator